MDTSPFTTQRICLHPAEPAAVACLRTLLALLLHPCPCCL